MVVESSMRQSSGYTIITYRGSGNANFVPPMGVSSFHVVVLGAGGDGGSGNQSTRGGGGGGGSHADGWIDRDVYMDFPIKLGTSNQNDQVTYFSGHKDPATITLLIGMGGQHGDGAGEATPGEGGAVWSSSLWSWVDGGSPSSDGAGGGGGSQYSTGKNAPMPTWGGDGADGYVVNFFDYSLTLGGGGGGCGLSYPGGPGSGGSGGGGTGGYTGFAPTNGRNDYGGGGGGGYIAAATSSGGSTGSTGSTAGSTELYGAEDGNNTGSTIGGWTGYASVITSGTYAAVSSFAGLVATLAAATYGSIVFIAANSTIDTTNENPINVPEGVTLASNRGVGGSLGGLIRRGYGASVPFRTIRANGDNVRITGLRLQGPTSTWDYDLGDNVKAGIMVDNHRYLEVDNCEIYYWSYCGVAFEHSTIDSWQGYVHHNNIHDCSAVGYGYGVMVASGNVLVEANIFENMRHAVIMEACGDECVEVRYNILGSNYTDGVIDLHRDCGGWTAGGVSGKLNLVHHNTCEMNSNYFLNIYGTPSSGLYVYNNIIETGILVRNTTDRIYMTNNYVEDVLYAEGPIDEP